MTNRVDPEEQSGPVQSPRPNVGNLATEDEALEWVVRRIADALDPLSIWLFGSRARGGHRPDSDFDLLVVTRIKDGEDGRDYDRAYAPIRGSGIGCDVVPIRIDDFVDEMDHPTSMFADIARNGVRVYGHRTGYVALASRSKVITFGPKPVGIG